MELSGKDKFHAFLGILAAVAVVTVVFAVIYFLVILAMTVIWNH
jgi:preprotein translocase subunit SecG